MANNRINKNLTRSLVALGTICAGAVIWASVSGQFQATPVAAQETVMVLPDAAPITPSSSSAAVVVQSVPAVTSGSAQSPAVGSLAPGVGSQPVVTPAPATTAAQPAVTVAPPVAVKTAPKLRTRGS